MKNIIKKSLGILLVGSLAVASSITVCATEDLYSTENQNGYGLGLGDEVYTIDDSQSSNYGIIADVTDKNILSLETSKVSEQKNFAGFRDDAVVEIYDIKVNYKTMENGKEVIKTTDDYEICDNIMLSIPCDNPNLYVIDVSNGITNGDLSFNYKNGKYYFYPSGPGSFMLSKEPAWSVELPLELNMTEQTMVDPHTGIEVSGEIPEGAMMYTTFEVVSRKDYIPEGDPNTLENDYSLPSLKDAFTRKVKEENINYDYEWYDKYSYSNGALVVDVVFVKDGNIVEVESDLEVTIPLDYYKALDSKTFEFVEDFASDFSEEQLAEIKRQIETSGVAKSFYLNHTTGNLVETEIVTKEGVEDKFTFKTGGQLSGTYFIGNEFYIDEMLQPYGWDYDDIDTLGKDTTVTTTGTAKDIATEKATDADKDTTTDVDVNLDVNINGWLFVLGVATNIIWIAVVIILVVKIKKKKSANK